MTKDSKLNLRINKEVRQTLEDAGYKMQEIFDEAISQLIDVEEKVSLKKFALREGIMRKEES